MYKDVLARLLLRPYLEHSVVAPVLCRKDLADTMFHLAPKTSDLLVLLIEEVSSIVSQDLGSTFELVSDRAVTKTAEAHYG
jgi:hypothetical protein